MGYLLLPVLPLLLMLLLVVVSLLLALLLLLLETPLPQEHLHLSLAPKLRPCERPFHPLGYPLAQGNNRNPTFAPLPSAWARATLNIASPRAC